MSPPCPHFRDHLSFLVQMEQAPHIGVAGGQQDANMDTNGGGQVSCGTVMCSIPATGRAHPSVPPREAAASNSVLSHKWVRQPRSWRCSACLGLAYSEEGLHRTPCPGVSPVLKALINDPKGHVLLVFPYTDCADTHFLVGCQSCRRYAGSLPKLTQAFGELCGRGREASDGAAQRRAERWKALESGHHPRAKSQALDPPIPLPTPEDALDSPEGSGSAEVQD